MRLNAFLPAVPKSRGALSRNSSTFPAEEGSLMRVVSFSGAFMPGLCFQSRNVDPTSRAPGPQRAIDELQPFRSLQQIPFKRRTFAHVADEKLPFDLERIVVGPVVRNFLPVCAKIVRLTHVRVPYRPGRFGKGLSKTAREPGNRGPLRPIHLKSHQVIAAYAHGPRTVEMRVRRDDLVTFQVDGTKGSAVEK